MNYLSEEVIRAIFLQIVQDMKYRPGLSVNTFGVTDEEPDLHTPSFGYTFADYLTGAFWSRTWINQGATADNLCGEFPALFFDLQSIQTDDEGAQTENTGFTFALIVLDKIECSACPESIVRNGLRVQANTIGMLRAIVNEFLTYKLYNVDGEYYWLAEGRAEGMDGDLYPESDIYQTVTNIGPVRRWGNYADIRGAVVEITVEFCWLVDSEFDYDQPVVESLARVPCNC